MRQSTSITGCVCWLVGLSVTHSFDDPHVAPIDLLGLVSFGNGTNLNEKIAKFAFAVPYQRGILAKWPFTSKPFEIHPGIGPEKKKDLLKNLQNHFLGLMLK